MDEKDGPSLNESAQPQTSDRKKQANRENAKHSTGPKTPRGKDMIRHNALKYGFYATDVVIRQGYAQESQEEFDILLRGLQRAWEPADVMQHSLVRTIAEADWRLRRARRAEVGEIRRQTDTYCARLFLDHNDSGSADGSIWSRPRSKQALSTTILEMKSKLALLTEARKDVEECGYVLESLQTLLDRKFGKDDPFITRYYQISHLVQYTQSEAGNNSGAGVERPLEGSQPSEGPMGADDYKKKLLEIIDAHAAVLKQFLENFEHAEQREHEATLLAHHLPSREFIDKLVKYESSLEKQKKEAINMLLKLKGKA